MPVAYPLAPSLDYIAEGIADTLLRRTNQMQPYVARFVKPTTPASWPMADTKSEKERKSKRQGLFGPGGFDGAYYLQLAELAEKTKTKTA